jgi:hypothetical protein|nr:MAG TPA: hypothetical protein [Caudoviricetes sp.]DAT13299.1 MAG TPA: hypothetical protein [Caudoviricetes sp.]
MMKDSLKTDYKSKTDNPGQNNNSSIPDVIDVNDPQSMNLFLRMAGGK